LVRSSCDTLYVYLYILEMFPMYITYVVRYMIRCMTILYFSIYSSMCVVFYDFSYIPLARVYGTQPYPSTQSLRMLMLT